MIATHGWLIIEWIWI